MKVGENNRVWSIGELPKKIGVREKQTYDEMEKMRKESDDVELGSKTLSHINKGYFSPSKLTSLFRGLRLEERKIMKDLMEEIKELEIRNNNT